VFDACLNSLLAAGLILDGQGYGIPAPQAAAIFSITVPEWLGDCSVKDLAPNFDPLRS
jgi:hypothetical protein